MFCPNPMTALYDHPIFLSSDPGAQSKERRKGWVGRWIDRLVDVGHLFILSAL